MTPDTLPVRVQWKIHLDSTGCWVWTGHRNPSGYGRTYDHRKHQTGMAHRYTYELLIGLVPEGLQLDHLCRNRACVNPDHLEPVTPAENSARGLRANQTHCIHGHPFDEANTWFEKTGHRHCRTCHRKRAAAWYARTKVYA